MATPGEETRKLARDVGQRSVGQLEAGLARIMGETGANNRWLLGALVLLNGGGIAVAAAETAWLDPRVLESAISLLVIGAALAVLGALASAFSSLLLSRQIGEASAHWTEVANSGEVSEAALKAAGRIRQIGQITSFVTPGIGFLSLVLFVGGTLTLASGLAGDVPAEAEPAPAAQMNVGTPPLPAGTPVPVPTPAANASQPEARPTPEAKVALPKPESKREPRRAPPRATETAPAPTSAPAAASPPAAAPAPAQPAPTPPSQ